MKTECPRWAPPLLAIQFLTRIPVPGLASLSREAALGGLVRSVAWFPLVGSLVGAITAGVIVTAEQFWPRLIAVVVALAIEARLTGAFHEDAMADFCDGVGGGRDPEHVRTIMKDSRIGTYGAMALLLGVGLRAVLTMSLPEPLLVAAVIAAATLARLQAVVVMAVVAPARESNTLARDVGGRVPLRRALLALLLALPGLAPLAFLLPGRVLGAIIAAAAFTFWFRRLLTVHVGGSTGDCLGFAAYVAQLLVLLAVCAV